MDLSEIHLKEHLGVVTSDTSTFQFSFFVSPFESRIGVGREDYVVIDHPVFGEMCPLLAVVKEIKSYEEVVGASMSEKSINIVAVGDVIGYVDLRDEVRSLHKLYIPPHPGSKVYLPYPEFLEDVFLRGPDGKPFTHALHIGELEARVTDRKGEVRPLNFYIDAEDFTRQHFLIAAISGAGKTHTATVIVEELANKAGCPVVILDPYGEYSTIGLAGRRFKGLLEEKEVPLKEYPFNFKVSIYVCDTEGVRDDLERGGVELGMTDRYSVKPISGRWMQALDEKGDHKNKDELKREVELAQVTIFDSRGLTPEERRTLFTRCVSTLWSGRLSGSVEPFVLVVEQAESIEAKTLGRIASEGRKLGVSMCLLSQHPAEMEGGVLSQMGTQLMGRTTDAGDLEYLGNMAAEKSGLLPQLRTGEWILNGISMRGPKKVFVRERYSLTA